MPYRGTAQSTLDLLEGRVEMQFGTIPPSLAHIREGKLRALAVTGAARNHTLPDVPTIAEVRPVRLRVLALAGDRRTGRDAARHHRAAQSRDQRRPQRCPEVRAAFAKHGVEPEPGSPEALGARIRDDVKKWRDVITSAGIREN